MSHFTAADLRDRAVCLRRTTVGDLTVELCQMLNGPRRAQFMTLHLTTPHGAVALHLSTLRRVIRSLTRWGWLPGARRLNPRERAQLDRRTVALEVVACHYRLPMRLEAPADAGTVRRVAASEVPGMYFHPEEWGMREVRGDGSWHLVRSESEHLGVPGGPPTTVEFHARREG